MSNDRLRVEVRPRVAAQRFALAAENIDPTPWTWHVLGADGFEWSEGQASFKFTALFKGWIVKQWEAHAQRIERRTKRKVEGGKRDENEVWVPLRGPIIIPDPEGGPGATRDG